MEILNNVLQFFSKIDPSPFFVLSLFPYLIFLYWAKKSQTLPKLSFIGFCLTLLFVLMTILLAIVAQLKFDDELTNVDTLHGIAESFLTISDGLVLLGFLKMREKLLVNNS